MSGRFPLFRKRDLLVFLVAFLLAAAGFWRWIPSDDALIAVVEQNGEVVKRVDLERLTEPQTLILEGEVTVTVQFEPGQVSITNADCPDQVCVRTGVLTRSGQSAVCLPARVAVRIEGENASGADGMTG